MSEIKNLFAKGWQNDTEPSLQPADTVRDLENMRLISDVNNTYALESLKGTVLNFSLNPGYFPIGWTRKEDNVVIFSTKDIEGTSQNGEIGVAVVTSASIGAYTPLYNHQALTFNSAHQIECQAYHENSFIERVYWTDNYNTYRAFNLNDLRFQTYFAVGALVIGVQYMVLSDSVTNGTNTYGPNQVSGTVFTADGTEVYNGSPAVIIYVDVSLLDAVPSRDQGNISFNRWLPAGNLLGGGYQYCYRLFTIDGGQTNFSYVSMPFHIGNTITPAISTLSYQAYQGTGITNNSLKGQRIQIDGIDTSFSRIQVVAIQDTGLISTATPIIFFDGAVTATTMNFDHLGNENLGSLTPAEISAIILSIKKVRTLAILKKRMFVGGVEFSKFIPFKNAGVTADTFEYLMPSDTTGRPADAPDANSAGLSGHGISLAAGVTPVTGVIFKNQWYRVGGTGQIAMVPSATLHAAGSVFQGGAGDTAFTVFSGAPTVIAVIRIQKYTGVYRYIDILDDWLDTKSAVVATHLRSLWRGETYRYGILFYDTFQSPQFVQWMLDKTTPEQYDNAGAWRLAEETNNYYGAGLHDLALRNIGMRFGGINFNAVAVALGTTLANLPNFIGGFSIVRAPLDNQILGQGILGPTVIDGNNTRPPAPLDIANDRYGAANGRRVQTYTFHCPEFEFAFNGLPNSLTGDQLNVVDRYNDTHEATPGAGTIETSGFHWYSKLYSSTGNSGGYGQKGDRNNVVVGGTINIGVGQSGIVYDPVNNPALLFENRSESAGFAPGGGNRTAVGSEAYCISTQANEPGTFPNGYAYHDETRSLVNYIRPKGNLYGGTGESALAATQYLFAGHYQPMDAAFMSYVIGNAGVADDIEVFGGDAFVCVCDIARMISDFNDVDPTSYGFFFPVESRINVSLRQGRHLSKDRTWSVSQVTGIAFANPPQVENFVYNFAYSYGETQFLYPALPVNFVPNASFERRVYVSPPKVDGEIIDNFKIFPLNDFIDLEGLNGALVNLRSKNGRLFYWQLRGFGYLPVQEREAFADALGNPLNIGEGGILQRYDDLQNFYGNQNQFGLAETEDKFVWFDLKRRTMCIANTSGEMVDLSTNKGLRSFFNDIPSSFLALDNPVRNQGIAVAYNSKFREVLFSFRGVGIPDDDHLRTPVGFTISFDCIDNQYTGKFLLLPGIMYELNNILLCAYTGASPVISGSMLYNVGNIINEGTVTYACILSYTSAGSPVQPSADTAHWQKTSDINEVHVADAGDIGKFFGYVYDTTITVVLNSADGNDNSVFDNVQMQSDPQFFDTATYTNSYQTGVDINISSDVDNYQYINRSWYWSVPYDNTDGDRMRDHFLLMKLDKDNRVAGNPTISKNERLKIVSMKHVMRKTL